MKPVSVLIAAREELADAMVWYEEQLKGLGLDLETEVRKAVLKLQKNPQMCQRYKNTLYRRQHVARFPFVVFFLETDDRIVVAAIAHVRRKPGYWRGRMIPPGP